MGQRDRTGTRPTVRASPPAGAAGSRAAHRARADATAAGHDQRSAAQLREELDHYKKQVEELKELCRGGSGSGDSASGDGDSDQVAALQRRVRELKDAHGRDLRDMFDKLAAKEEEVARARQASESLRRAEMDMDDLKDEVNVLRMARDRFRAEAEELGQRLEEEGAQASGATADAASRAEQAEAEVERLRAALEEEQRKRAAQEKESSVELASACTRRLMHTSIDMHCFTACSAAHAHMHACPHALCPLFPQLCARSSRRRRGGARRQTASARPPRRALRRARRRGRRLRARG